MLPSSGCARGSGRQSASPRSMPRRSRLVCLSRCADRTKLRDDARAIERRANRSAAGVTEAAGTARGWREFIDLDDVGADDGRYDELGDAIAGFDHDRLLAQI